VWVPRNIAEQYCAMCAIAFWNMSNFLENDPAAAHGMRPRGLN